MKKNILLIGTGGHANSLADVINQSGKYKVFGMIAKSKNDEKVSTKHKIVGLEKNITKIKKNVKCAIISFGGIKSFRRRLPLFNKLKKLGYKFPTIISKFSYVSKNSSIGDGTIVMHGAFVNSGSKIDQNCIINSKSIVEHDVIIGKNSHIAPGAIVCGSAKIGNNCIIGAGSVIKEGIKVSSNSIVGANSFLDKDLKSNKIFVSKTKKVIKDIW